MANTEPSARSRLLSLGYAPNEPEAKGAPYYCASCLQRFTSTEGLYTGGGDRLLHDADEEQSAACGPVLRFEQVEH